MDKAFNNTPGVVKGRNDRSGVTGASATSFAWIQVGGSLYKAQLGTFNM